MRYSDLGIETQRQQPARTRSEGAAFLRRAGFRNREASLTPLGERVSARLEGISRTCNPKEFFARLELPVKASSDGAYYFESPTGRQEIIHCPSCHYTAQRELARFAKSVVAPAIPGSLEKVATPDCHTIDALADYLGIRKEDTAKALMYTRAADGAFIFVVIRGDMQLSDSKLQNAVGDVRPATADEIVASGATPGYASPIGLKSAFIVADDVIPKAVNLVAGANEAGFHFKNTNYGRDYQASLVSDLALAEAGHACPNCGKALATLSAELLLDASGYHMESVMDAVADQHHNEVGITWPAAASPFDVYLLHLPGKELDTRGKAAELRESWEQSGITVLLDDRDERAGVKFMDADLIGCPVRATVGERGMRAGMIELKSRGQSETQLVPFADALKLIRLLINTTS